MEQTKKILYDLQNTICTNMRMPGDKIEDSPSIYRTSATTFQICSEELKKYINQAIPLKKIIVDSETLYVCDISNLADSDYNSLVFQYRGDVLKSKETTTQIMQSYFNDHVPYSTIQNLGRVININRKCPYVAGTIVFVPDKGPSKQNVNWIGLHHLKNYSSYKDKTLLSFVHHHELIINLNIKNVHKLFDQAIRLYLVELQISREWQLLFAPTQSFDTDTLLQRKTRSKMTGTDAPSPIGWHTKLVYSLSYKMVTLTLGEDDPYLEDIKEAFSLIEDEIET
ncbi:hypothetical protein BKP56_11065 [Marinilactibacillus sp. 15R]|uniref:competence protein ComK n=1 Tax=Marinilactibacillus sp. 15R TaxID=1911586 RepID=UPI00090B2D53|nr:competence protein ComK [Marinilactibacillus sp. 15R]API89766.1 hypothetical protein BKP56_11065 [Marinilactibacillus sp. 15R]